MEENTLVITGLQAGFPAPRGEVLAADGVDLTIPRGTIAGLVGESGCGKSVTALSVMGLLPPPGRVKGGTITFEGRDLTALSEAERRKLRGDRMAMIFQDPMTSLNPVYPVGRQVAEVLRLHRGLDRKAARAQVIDLFRQVGIPDPEARYDAYPRQLSGGLRQRVMIAMAMACRPALLIADEPTTALDGTIQAQILRLMAQLCRQAGTAILLITHNMGVVAQLCDQVSVMYAGQVVEAAETFALFAAPRHPYTLGLLQAIPSVESAQDRLYTIPGTVPELRDPPPGCRFCPRCDRAQPICSQVPPPLTEVAPGHWVRCFLAGKEGM
ncbi:MAG TPA: ABC transporter ATP-binding protein [Candidatus Evtepia faecigallinarum]|nr:ABC transporter ATP-binding protein [Candidatus Evtepia faecigallinarum]